MKASLIVLALIAASLSACMRKERPEPQPTNAANVKIVSVEPGNYNVYQHCIKGVAYLTYSKTIIVQVTEDGKPQTCVVSP